MIYDSVVLVSHSLKCVPSFCENLSNQLIASFLSRDHPRSQGSAFGVGYHRLCVQSKTQAPQAMISPWSGSVFNPTLFLLIDPQPGKPILSVNSHCSVPQVIERVR